MSLPEIASRADWLAARKDLLAKEKELTRARDALNAERRRLPMVPVDKDYVFDGTGRRGPPGRPVRRPPPALPRATSCSTRRGTTAARVARPPPRRCPTGLLAHLHARDTAFVTVSRAPLAKIEDYKARRGWTFPWYSSLRQRLQLRLRRHARQDGAPLEYNYDQPAGQRGRAGREREHGSCFLRVGDDVFHTYSTFARGAEMLGGSYYWLDLTALGRQEDWEEPKGRADAARRATPDFAT